MVCVSWVRSVREQSVGIISQRGCACVFRLSGRVGVFPSRENCGLHSCSGESYQRFYSDTIDAIQARVGSSPKTLAASLLEERVMKTMSRVGLSALMTAALLLSSASAMAQAKKHSPADLAVGKLAPEISGVDVDGRKFKLSDYRGKVVVLDFWGDW